LNLKFFLIKSSSTSEDIKLVFKLKSERIFFLISDSEAIIKGFNKELLLKN